MEMWVEVVFSPVAQGLTRQPVLLIVKEGKIGTVVVESSDVPSFEFLNHFYKHLVEAGHQLVGLLVRAIEPVDDYKHEAVAFCEGFLV